MEKVMYYANTGLGAQKIKTKYPPVKKIDPKDCPKCPAKSCTFAWDTMKTPLLAVGAFVAAYFVYTKFLKR